jgi:hypothetical protein
MQCLNSGFNKLKMDDLTHIKMLVVQEMWKNSLNHSSVIVKYWIACVIIYYNKYKMQFGNNGFNILKVNGSILIIKNMWKKSLIHSNINVGFKIVTCVLIKYGNCKTQFRSNGFNMLKVDNSTHVSCW